MQADAGLIRMQIAYAAGNSRSNQAPWCIAPARMKNLRHNQHDLRPMFMTPLRRLPFTQFDVFTSRALEGNPLAVFPDGRGLSDDEMQAIAKEMNLSETTYILPRDA